MSTAAFFETILATDLDVLEKVLNITTESGGCINQAYHIQTKTQHYFIKVNEAKYLQMFEKESFGLDVLRKQSEFKIPVVFGYGILNAKCYLLMEYLPVASKESRFWERLGYYLGALHAISDTSYGLDHDNFIGSLPQSNEKKTDWVAFFIHNRLLAQLSLAKKNKLVTVKHLKKFDGLFKILASILPKEPPALLHGDLWSGNVLATINDMPSLIDPAIYFGHREAEMAFTKLFGGFHPTFYNSYNNVNPLEPGFDQRIDIYNLYPLLVHLNLFGSSYLSQINGIIKRF